MIIHTIGDREWMDWWYRKLQVLTALSIDPTVGGTSVNHNCYCLRLDYAREDQGLWCTQRKSTQRYAKRPGEEREHGVRWL
jgi:hypothetical protein